MNRGHGDAQASRGSIILAFAAIYVIWGSTYLAIRFAVETLPPFLMAGVRFLIAGAILFVIARRRTDERIVPAHWKSAAVIGGLLLLGGNGLVSWSEQTVPSGLAAMLVTTVPIWMVLLHWLQRDGVRPSGAEVAGMVLGFLGVVLLIGTDELGGGRPADRLGMLSLVLASLLWSIGSLRSKHATLPKSPLLATSMEMLCGGALLALTGLLLGEGGRVEFAAVTYSSVMALCYLIVFGSLIGFSAYVWLLRVTTPAKVSTYAFVNPAVAVFIGYAFGGEPLTTRSVIASAVIVASVVLVIGTKLRNPVGLARKASPSTDAPRTEPAWSAAEAELPAPDDYGLKPASAAAKIPTCARRGHRDRPARRRADRRSQVVV